MRSLLVMLATTGVASAQPAFTTTVTTTTTVTFDDAPPPLAPPSLVAPAPPPPTARAFRLTAAVGPGYGFDTKDECGKMNCIGATIEVGGAIAARWLLMVTASILYPVDYHEDYVQQVHHVETLALQYAPSRQWWFEAGLGAGSKRSWIYDNVAPPRDILGIDIAGTAAAGRELVARDGYSLGVQARVASTVDVHHTSFAQLLVGVSWY